MAWEGYLKTRKGRRVYDRKKHPFTWQRASRICFTLINDDIPYQLRDRYYARMRAGHYAYSHVMLRLYPELAKGYIRGLAEELARESADLGIRDEWKQLTFDIIKVGLNYFSELSGLDPNISQQLQNFALFLGNKYYDFLFSLTN